MVDIAHPTEQKEPNSVQLAAVEAHSSIWDEVSKIWTAPPVEPVIQQPIDPIKTAQNFLPPADQKKYGLSVRVRDDQVEAFFRAGGKDNVVASTTLEDAANGTKAKAKLDRLIDGQMQTLERQYKVTFARPGEKAGQQETAKADCTTEYGQAIRAHKPTFGDLYATREALAHSQPSQLNVDGTKGIKLYFMDKPFFTKPAYGNKPALALYESSGPNGEIAMLITPDAEKLPVSAKDAADPQARNLAYIIEHELTHNSQNNMWDSFAGEQDKVAAQFGWETNVIANANHGTFFGGDLLKGSNGVGYINSRPQCGVDTAWMAIKDHHPLDAQGRPVDTTDRARKFTNDQVAADAQVKPLTYYFPNPKEMFSEGLANFRNGRASRERELNLSPALYAVVSRHDQKEIAKYYGVDASGHSKFIRNADGLIVARTPAAEAELARFEQRKHP